jgi:hypothetical protein
MARSTGVPQASRSFAPLYHRNLWPLGGHTASVRQANVNIDWQSVKKQTLWSYEDLIRKLQDVLAYSFVQEHSNHTLEEAQAYAGKIRQGYLQGRGDTAAYVDGIAAYLHDLETRWAGTYAQLVHSVDTRERCVGFLQQTAFDFDQLVQTLNYLLRWVMPFRTPLREYMHVDTDVESRQLEELKKQQIGSNLDLIEIGRSEAGRLQLASATQIPVDSILALVHRVDISRLAYVRGKTVKHLCGGGYDSLEKIATADLAEMEQNMDAYYRTIGKTLASFQAVIPLAWMVGGAQILPRVVEAE